MNSNIWNSWKIVLFLHNNFSWFLKWKIKLPYISIRQSLNLRVLPFSRCYLVYFSNYPWAFKFKSRLGQLYFFLFEVSHYAFYIRHFKWNITLHKQATNYIMPYTFALIKTLWPGPSINMSVSLSKLSHSSIFLSRSTSLKSIISCVYRHVLLYSTVFSLVKCCTCERSNGHLITYFASVTDLHGFLKFKKIHKKIHLGSVNSGIY